MLVTKIKKGCKQQWSFFFVIFKALICVGGGGMPSWNVYSAELKQNEQYWEDITFKTLSTNTRGIKLVAELVTRFWRQTEEQFIWKVMWHLLDLEQMQTLNTFFFLFLLPSIQEPDIKVWSTGRARHILHLHKFCTTFTPWVVYFF